MPPVGGSRSATVFPVTVTPCTDRGQQNSIPTNAPQTVVGPGRSALKRPTAWEVVAAANVAFLVLAIAHGSQCAYLLTLTCIGVALLGFHALLSKTITGLGFLCFAVLFLSALSLRSAIQPTWCAKSVSPTIVIPKPLNVQIAPLVPNGSQLATLGTGSQIGSQSARLPEKDGPASVKSQSSGTSSNSSSRRLLIGQTVFSGFIFFFLLSALYHGVGVASSTRPQRRQTFLWGFKDVLFKTHKSTNDVSQDICIVSSFASFWQFYVGLFGALFMLTAAHLILQDFLAGIPLLILLLVGLGAWMVLKPDSIVYAGLDNPVQQPEKKKAAKVTWCTGMKSNSHEVPTFRKKEKPIRNNEPCLVIQDEVLMSRCRLLVPQKLAAGQPSRAQRYVISTLFLIAVTAAVVCLACRLSNVFGFMPPRVTPGNLNSTPVTSYSTSPNQSVRRMLSSVVKKDTRENWGKEAALGFSSFFRPRSLQSVDGMLIGDREAPQPSDFGYYFAISSAVVVGQGLVIGILLWLWVHTNAKRLTQLFTGRAYFSKRIPCQLEAESITEEGGVNFDAISATVPLTEKRHASESLVEATDLSSVVVTSSDSHAEKSMNELESIHLEDTAVISNESPCGRTPCSTSRGSLPVMNPALCERNGSASRENSFSFELESHAVTTTQADENIPSFASEEHLAVRLEQMVCKKPTVVQEDRTPLSFPELEPTNSIIKLVPFPECRNFDTSSSSLTGSFLSSSVIIETPSGRSLPPTITVESQNVVARHCRQTGSMILSGSLSISGCSPHTIPSVFLDTQDGVSEDTSAQFTKKYTRRPGRATPPSLTSREQRTFLNPLTFIWTPRQRPGWFMNGTTKSMPSVEEEQGPLDSQKRVDPSSGNTEAVSLDACTRETTESDLLPLKAFLVEEAEDAQGKETMGSSLGTACAGGRAKGDGKGEPVGSVEPVLDVEEPLWDGKALTTARCLQIFDTLEKRASQGDVGLRTVHLGEPRLTEEHEAFKNFDFAKLWDLKSSFRDSHRCVGATALVASTGTSWVEPRTLDLRCRTLCRSPQDGIGILASVSEEGSSENAGAAFLEKQEGETRCTGSEPELRCIFGERGDAHLTKPESLFPLRTTSSLWEQKEDVFIDYDMRRLVDNSDFMLEWSSPFGLSTHRDTANLLFGAIFPDNRPLLSNESFSMAARVAGMPHISEFSGSPDVRTVLMNEEKSVITPKRSARSVSGEQQSTDIPCITAFPVESQFNLSAQPGREEGGRKTVSADGVLERRKSLTDYKKTFSNTSDGFSRAKTLSMQLSSLGALADTPPVKPEGSGQQRFSSPDRKYSLPSIHATVVVDPGIREPSEGSGIGIQPTSVTIRCSDGDGMQSCYSSAKESFCDGGERCQIKWCSENNDGTWINNVSRDTNEIPKWGSAPILNEKVFSKREMVQRNVAMRSCAQISVTTTADTPPADSSITRSFECSKKNVESVQQEDIGNNQTKVQSTMQKEALRKQSSRRSKRKQRGARHDGQRPHHDA